MIDQIKEGYQEYFKSILGVGNSDITKIADSRLKLCYECPKRVSFICGSCGCVLAVKTRSISSKCPINKW